MNMFSLIFVVPACLFFVRLDKYKLFYQTERFWALFVFYTSGFFFKFEKNRVRLDPHKQYMIVSNHTSMLDIMIMLILHDKNPIVFVGKSEVKDYPLLGYVFKKAHIVVDRKSKESRKQVYESVKDKLAQGLSICIFPEGGVPNESITLNEFKDGAFGMAIMHQVPIVVYTLGEVKKRLPFSVLKGSPGLIRIKQHEIIDTEGLLKDDVKEIKEKIYTIILNQLNYFNKM